MIKYKIAEFEKVTMGPKKGAKKGGKPKAKVGSTTDASMSTNGMKSGSASSLESAPLNQPKLGLTDALIEKGNNALASMELGKTSTVLNKDILILSFKYKSFFYHNLCTELAQKFFIKAHETNDKDTNIMDALSDVCIQLGERDQALALLRRSTTEAPDINPFKWLYLAQLTTGMESVEIYRKAITYIQHMLVNPADNSEVSYKGSK